MLNNKKINDLENLIKEILDKKICADLALESTQLVFGSGDPDAKIVFIGEAPGKQEDLQGEPFVGASGKFLNEMLKSINLMRNDVYITNIVKYRPPNNRDPSMAEKAEFLPYLLKQIEIINPRVIVTLGRHSMEQFLPGGKIGEVHGTLVKLENGTLLMPLYHPAAALYNGKLRQILKDDFVSLKGVI